jgi:NhaC family Na+:H+ antiporter
VAALPLVVMGVVFLLGSTVLGVGIDLLVVTMLVAATVAGAVAVRMGGTWHDIEASTAKKIAAVLPMILILLAIGMLIGTWVLSGTIPVLIYYGIELVSPRYLVLTAFLVTAVMSLATGTSWGSAGTIGVALVGTAIAVDASVAATAGAVVSGAYFGDKMSPLSDTTNISALAAGADLYAHIRHMTWTAVPSFALALVVYTVAGGSLAPAGATMPDSATRLLGEIDTVYRLSPWALLPPLVVVAGIVRKYPAVLTIAASSALALVVGVLVQGFGLIDALGAAVSGFQMDMVTTLGLDVGAFSDTFRELLQRGGLYSMVDTLLVIIAAFLLAGAMDVSGALDALLSSMLAAVRSVGGLIATTMAAGAVMISLTSHAGVTALIIGGLFQKAYDERDLAPVNLSRSLEDSVTIVEPLMPWTVTGLFMATTLGVPTLEYLPWATFCYTGSFFSLFWAAAYGRTGLGIKRVAGGRDEPRTRDGAPAQVG